MHCRTKGNFAIPDCRGNQAVRLERDLAGTPHPTASLQVSSTGPRGRRKGRPPSADALRASEDAWSLWSASQKTHSMITNFARVRPQPLLQKRNCTGLLRVTLWMKLADPALLHTSLSLPRACVHGSPPQSPAAQSVYTPRLRLLTPPHTLYFWGQASSTHLKQLGQS